MMSNLLVMIVQQKLHQEQRTLQVRQAVPSAVVFGMKSVGNVELYEPFKVAINIGKVKITDIICIPTVNISYQLLLLHE